MQEIVPPKLNFPCASAFVQLHVLILVVSVLLAVGDLHILLHYERHVKVRNMISFSRLMKDVHFLSISSSSRSKETTSVGFKVSGLKLPPEITIF